MKRCAVALVALWATVAQAEVLDMKLYDAFGATYESTNIGNTLGAIYDISFNPTMVIILGPTLEHPELKEQRKIVEGIDPDEHGVLFAVGTPSQTYGRGFSVAPNKAAELMPNPQAFHVIVLDADGTVLAESDELLSRERLIELSPSEE